MGLKSYEGSEEISECVNDSIIVVIRTIKYLNDGSRIQGG